MAAYPNVTLCLRVQRLAQLEYSSWFHGKSPSRPSAIPPNVVLLSMSGAFLQLPLPPLTSLREDAIVTLT